MILNGARTARHHQNNHSSADNKGCLLNEQNGRYEFSDLTVYPVQALDRLQVQARRVDQLVRNGYSCSIQPLNGEFQKQNQQHEKDSWQSLICIVAELYYQKDAMNEDLSANTGKNTQSSNKRYLDEPRLFFPDLVSAVCSVGLPLLGEISPYRQVALFAPLVDALDEVTTNLVSELIRLLILTKGTKQYQVVHISEATLQNRLTKLIDSFLESKGDE